MKSVCFLADDREDGTKLVTNFGGVENIEKSLCSIDGKLYLFGNVARPSKLPKKGNANVVAYNVEWEDVSLGVTKIDLQVVVPALDLSVVMRRRQKPIRGGRPQKYRTGKLFDDDVLKSLFAVYEGEDGDPMESDTANDDEDDEREEPEDDDDLFITVEAKQKEGSQATKEPYREEAETTDTKDSSRFQ